MNAGEVLRLRREVKLRPAAIARRLGIGSSRRRRQKHRGRRRDPSRTTLNKTFLEQSLAAASTIQPDKLTQTGKKATVEGMQDKRVLSDAAHIVEL